MVKKDFPEVNLVIVGGKEAPYVRLPLDSGMLISRQKY